MTRANGGHSDEATGDRDLLVEFDRRRGHMRRALHDSLRAAVQDGRLAAGTVLPASRRLAADLGVSRGVVTDAYDRLISEGYLLVEPRAAPVVASVVASATTAPDPPEPTWRFDFTATTPEVALFPRRVWMRAVERALHAAPDSVLDYGDHRGRVELRTALSAYLGRARGVRVDPAHVLVTQGFTQALDLLCRVLAEGGRRRVAMESPSHPGLWATVRDSGLDLLGCPVDSDGLDVTGLDAIEPDAVVVAPAHQFPTGAVLTPSRRAALVRWAAARRGLVVEDDYDAEFRYDRTPVGAVQGLDPDHVAHVGSASKTLAPGLRLGWISAPAELVDGLRARKSAADSGSPAVDQLALADLLRTGEYDRHVVRLRHVYRRRRDLLMHALAERLPGIEVRGIAAGMQALLVLPDHVDDVALAESAATRRLNLSPLSPLHLVPSAQRGALLGFGRIPEVSMESAVDALVSTLAEAGLNLPRRPQAQR